MKKIMGFLAIIVMAVAVFAATKNVDHSANMDLASLTSLNTANAECIDWGYPDGQCNVWGLGECSMAYQYFDCNLGAGD